MTTHTFTPTTYYNTLGPHPPVLTIADGDTVVTTTIDAGGYDAAGAQHNTQGNPMTGPFFIGGAERGDTLAVRFDVMRPNRTHGFTLSHLAPNVVDPEVARELPQAELRQWQVDLEGWA